MSDTNSLIGKLLGNYRVLEMLGWGGFGDVYKGQHNLLGTTVAIKVLRSSYSEYDTQASKKAEELLQEAQMHQKLKHPFILPLLDVGKLPLDSNQQEGMLYMVMEYAPGGSLRTLLNKHPGQPLPVQEALTILWQIGQALNYAHQRREGAIVHRDLKPENILFNVQGDPMVADFGLATELVNDQTTSVDHRGSPPYMSPEQFDTQVSAKSDQYSLGCIAYELLTGQLPFTGGNNLAWWIQHKTVIPENPAIHNPQIPAVVSQAILRALEKNRTARHSTILQFVETMRGTGPQKSFNEWYWEGQRCYEAGNFSASLAAYQEASILHPTFADAHFNKGLTLYRLQSYEQASAALQQAIGHDPGTVKFYVQAGITFSQRGLFVDAVSMYKRAVQLDAHHKKACELLGDAHYKLKHYQDSIQAYKQALGLNVFGVMQRRNAKKGRDPDEARIYMNLGLVLKHAQKNNEALVAFECAIDLNSGLKQAYYNKGNLLHECGLYQSAVQTFDQALSIDPLYIHAYRAKSKALFSLELFEEAQLAEEIAYRLAKREIR